MIDKDALEATDENKNRPVFIRRFASHSEASFEGESETIAERYGWNHARQIYFHLETQGYENINS